MSVSREDKRPLEDVLDDDDDRDMTRYARNGGPYAGFDVEDVLYKGESEGRQSTDEDPYDEEAVQDSARSPRVYEPQSTLDQFFYEREAGTGEWHREVSSLQDQVTGMKDQVSQIQETVASIRSQLNNRSVSSGSREAKVPSLIKQSSNSVATRSDMVASQQGVNFFDQGVATRSSSAAQSGPVVGSRSTHQTKSRSHASYRSDPRSSHPSQVIREVIASQKSDTRSRGEASVRDRAESNVSYSHRHSRDRGVSDVYSSVSQKTGGVYPTTLSRGGDDGDTRLMTETRGRTERYEEEKPKFRIGEKGTAMAISLNSAKEDHSEHAKVVVELNNPDLVVEKLLHTLARKFPPEAVLTITPNAVMDINSEDSRELKSARVRRRDREAEVVPIKQQSRDIRQDVQQNVMEQIREIREEVRQEVMSTPSPRFDEDGVPIRYVEIEVPEEVIRKIPKIEIVEVEKRVPKREIVEVERIVEIPDIQYVDKLVEVERVEEVVREVRTHKVVDVPKEMVRYINTVVDKIVERVVEVPGEVIEVPKPYRVEQRVPVPRYNDSDKQTVVAQVVHPSVQYNGVRKVPLHTYEPRVMSVDVFVPVPIQVSPSIKTKASSHNNVDVPEGHYNALVRRLNPGLEDVRLENLYKKTRDGRVPMLPLEHIEIVPVTRPGQSRGNEDYRQSRGNEDYRQSRGNEDYRQSEYRQDRRMQQAQDYRQDRRQQPSYDNQRIINATEQTIQTLGPQNHGIQVGTMSTISQLRSEHTRPEPARVKGMDVMSNRTSIISHGEVPHLRLEGDPRVPPPVPLFP